MVNHHTLVPRSSPLSRNKPVCLTTTWLHRKKPACPMQARYDDVTGTWLQVSRERELISSFKVIASQLTLMPILLHHCYCSDEGQHGCNASHIT